MKSVFLLKRTLRFFIFKFNLNPKHLFFQIKAMIHEKKHFTEKSMKTLLNSRLYTHDITCNLSR